MRRMLMDMRPQSFEDVAAAIALFRPGPMVNIPAFIARKQGREPIEYMHERLEPILRETYGVMIYQEQVMMAARELAGFTMSEADILRAAMGKKDKAKMAKLRTKFVDGTIERGIPKATAEALFDGIAKFAEYGFNRAHSAAYAVISYQTAYLKANFPIEYMTALLIHMEGSADRVATAIVDCRLRGIDVLAPDINQSRTDFSMTDGRILFGLAAIKNVGRHAVESIVGLRDQDGPFKSLEDLCERTSAIQDVNRRVLEALVQSGTCDTLGERARLIAALDHAVSRAERARRDRESGQTSLLDMVGSPETHAEDYGLTIDVAPMAGDEKLRLEKELRGLYLSDHPLRRISGELAKLETEVETASVVADMAWLWADPECVPVSRRQLVHVRIPSGESGLAEQLEAVLARHPGTDEVVLHVVVGSREVVVNADRYHVLAGPALAAEIDQLVGEAATRLETVRPKAQSNGNGRGYGERGRRA